MPSGVAYLDGVAAAYAPLGLKYAADEAADQAHREGLYVCSGGAVTASATQGDLDLAAGTDFLTSTELNYSAQATKPGTLSSISTTVAAGSNNVHTNTFAGSGSLVVGSTGGGAPSTGLLAIIHSGVVQSVVSYGSITDGTHFGACALVSGWSDYTMLTGDTVTVINNDLTLSKWLNVEVDSSGNYQTVAGTASATPVKPALTASRVLHASLLLQPVSGNASALSIDGVGTNANGKSKLIECRRLVTTRNARVLARDTSATTLTNPTSLTTLLASAPSVPGNSLNIGDTLLISGSGFYANNVAASTIIWDIGWFSASSFIIPGVATESLNTSANNRRWSFAFTVTITAIGASANGSIEGGLWVTAPSTNAVAPASTGGGANGSGLIPGGNHSSTWDSTAAQTFDLKVQFGTTSAGATIGLRNFTIIKLPA